MHLTSDNSDYTEACQARNLQVDLKKRGERGMSCLAFHGYLERSPILGLVDCEA